MDWRGKAEAIAASISKRQLHSKAVEALDTSTFPVAVACSGGLDSMAALLLVYAHFPLLRSRMSVLHFNHLLRGAASDEDAAFVNAVATTLDLPVTTQSWIERDQNKSVSEADARKARQAFFDTFSAKHGGAFIVSGHQQNDILETMLLRIARGSNLRGLSAPRPVSNFSNGKTIVRPLLCLSKSTLENAMRSAGIEWREDASNEKSIFDRNRLRNEVLPVWQAATHFDLVQAAGQVRDYLEEADEIIDRYLAFSRYPPPSCNPAELPFRPGPRGVLRRWVQLWIAEHRLSGSIPPSAVNEILDVLFKNGQHQWSVGEGFLRVDGSGISFETASPTVEPWPGDFRLNPGSEVTLPTGAKLSARHVVASSELLSDLKSGKYSEELTVLIDSDCLKNSSFVVRAWIPGDRYQAINSPGTRKLQDMFVDRKIPREERNNLPVVTTSDSKILWCPGLPVAHQLRVTEKTKEILQLTYTRLH